MCVAVALASQGPIPVVAQTDTEHWTLPRTPWGDSDLQGVWNNNARTPLERPEEFADQAFLSVEERAAYTARRQASREDRDSREAREAPTPMSAARTTPTGTPCPEKRSAARRSFSTPRMGRFLP